MENSNLEQLYQLTTVTWDGNVINKTALHDLQKKGFCVNVDGYNLLTKKGMRVLVDFKLVNNK